MIAIHSSADEPSTDDVLDWLYYLQDDISLRRFNDSVVIDEIALFLGEGHAAGTLSLNGTALDISQLRSSWYRRGMLMQHIPGMEDTLGQWRHLLMQEHRYLLHYIDNLLFPATSGINKFQDVHINKLHCLSVAQSVGLSIPATLITSHFSTLLNFAREGKAIILKPVGTAFFKMPVSERYTGHIVNTVRLVAYEQLKTLITLYPDDTMQPTLAQQYIEKKWEIRSFFLKNSFYSMAIFSQQNEKTRVDFRNDDPERPNRCLPFQLPVAIEEKLRRLMHLLDLNCGSFDMIYTPQGSYVFLEVNPIGQYQWLNQNCNYFIDKHVARRLLQYEQYGPDPID